jgi:hypothetical protein
MDTLTNKQFADWKRRWSLDAPPELERWVYANLQELEDDMRQNLSVMCYDGEFGWDVAADGPCVVVMWHDEAVDKAATNVLSLLEDFFKGCTDSKGAPLLPEYEHYIEPGLAAVERKIAELRERGRGGRT